MRILLFLILSSLFIFTSVSAEITDVWVETGWSDEAGIVIGNFTCELTDPSGNTSLSCTGIDIVEEGVDYFRVTVTPGTNILDEAGVWMLHMYTAGNITEWVYQEKYVTVTDGASTDQISIDEVNRRNYQAQAGKVILNTINKDLTHYDYDLTTILFKTEIQDNTGTATSNPKNVYRKIPKN